MRIKKGDQVIVISGKDRGRKGKVLEAFPGEEKILIEGANLRKKHLRPKKSGEKGEIVQLPAPINVSNVKLICPKCGQPARVGHKVLENGKKFRVCKKCKQEI